MFDVVKRGLILIFFLAISAWLVWRGNSYNDQNYSLIPAVMCAAESLVLVFLAAALIRRGTESEE